MSDPRLQTVVNAGLTRVQSAVRMAAMQCVESLERALFSGTSSDTERFVWQTAATDLRRKLPAFNTLFNTSLKDRVHTELAKVGAAPGRSFADTDWRTLALVDDHEVEEQVAVDRLNRDISSECEWELREYDTFIRALMLDEPEERQRNPLRPELLARALVKAVNGVCDDAAGRKVLIRELGKPVSRQMKGCYTTLLQDMQQRGIEAVQLAVKTVEGPGNELAREGVRDTGYQAMKRDTRSDALAAQALGALFGMSVPADLSEAATSPADLRSVTGREGLPTGWRASGFGGGGLGGGGGGGGGGGSGGHPFGAQGGQGGQGGGGPYGDFPTIGMPAGSDAATPGGGYGGDARMLDLIRRLATIATSQGGGHGHGPAGLGGSGRGGPGMRPGEATGGGGFAPGSAGGYGAQGGQAGAGGPAGAWASTWSGPAGGAASRSGVPSGPGAGAPRGLAGALTGDWADGDAPAPNVIRAYRSELREAANGALDHMVIDIVAALFDQVLADPNVPPQMARQIARLQLPVLRAALKDVGFFRSRRHPVRRFVNRIATLAAAHDQFDDGAGLELLEKVRALVQDIIEGDFDQVELYERKLAELEALVGTPVESEKASHAKVAALLDGKENLLRLQQRYTLALKAPLADLALPEFAAEFLAQVWSQVVVYSSIRDGHEADSVKHARATARDLVLSLQPKGSPQLRKEFLVRLPQLMKDLNEGLSLVRWPEEGKRAFFGKLLPAHAASLKQAPLQDFDQRMLNQKLDVLDRIAVPDANEAAPTRPDDATEYDTAPISALIQQGEQTVPVPFTEEEKAEVGLVEEAEVDWDGQVDIDVGMVAGGDVVSTGQEIDLNLDAPPPPHAGVQLIHHMQPGSAYLMQVDSGGWKKVRLSWVSPGRGFFVFTQGRKEQRTLSMTSRMLHRLCESGKFRAFEQAELIERATIRARRQLAKLGGPSTH